MEFLGLIACLYRFLLTESESTLQNILSVINEDIYLILDDLVLAILDFVTRRLMRWKPFATGRSIPQVISEIKGYFNPNGERLL